MLESFIVVAAVVLSSQSVQNDAPLGSIDLFECSSVVKTNGKKGYGFDLKVRTYVCVCACMCACVCFTVMYIYARYYVHLSHRCLHASSISQQKRMLISESGWTQYLTLLR